MYLFSAQNLPINPICYKKGHRSHKEYLCYGLGPLTCPFSLRSYIVRLSPKFPPTTMVKEMRLIPRVQNLIIILISKLKGI